MMKDGSTSVRMVLREFIVRNYLVGSADPKFGDDDSFLGQGIIDSIGVIELAQFVMKHFSVRVGPNDIIPENFDTIANLARYIERKKERKV